MLEEDDLHFNEIDSFGLSQGNGRFGDTVSRKGGINGTVLLCVSSTSGISSGRVITIGLL